MSAPDELVIDALIKAIVAYNNTPNWDAARAVVEARREILLTSSADVIYEILIVAEGDKVVARKLGARRVVLGLCRAVGIEAAFRRAKERFGDVL
ncbi:MAG: hypothetical protein JXB47_08605 [Anaerolineae bacterium]|nr:hypothetical protein [Anaerolineae bacterium]